MKTRERLRQEIESTQAAFHRLLDSLPEEALSLPSDNPAWTIRQVLYHIAIIPRYMIVEVVMIRRQVWLYQLLPRLIPKGLFDWLNVRITRLGARKSRRQLAEVYDRSCRASLQALDSVDDADFGKSLFYPLWDPLLAGHVTVEFLFGYIKRHFDSHAAQIESIVHIKDE
ncbi:MAG: DinB family protein [Caldilineaceae bacterium]